MVGEIGSRPAENRLRLASMGLPDIPAAGMLTPAQMKRLYYRPYPTLHVMPAVIFAVFLESSASCKTCIILPPGICTWRACARAIPGPTKGLNALALSKTTSSAGFCWREVFLLLRRRWHRRDGCSIIWRAAIGAVLLSRTGDARLLFGLNSLAMENHLVDSCPAAT